MDQIDRELASLLSVEPSPEFRARVRARIASEPLPRSWYFQWRVAAACTAAATAVAVVTMMRVAPTLRPPAAAPPVEYLPSAPVPVVASAPAQLPHPDALPMRRSSPRASNPEVLIDASAKRGLLQLDALVRAGRAQLIFDSEPREPIRDVVITPIEIVPIEIATVSELAGDVEGDQQ